MKLINLEQNTPEWLEFRRRRIGASEWATILGLNPHKTPLQLWEEKLGLRELPAYNERMQEGHRIEPIARQWFNESCDYNFVPKVGVHDIYDWLHASFDGIDEDTETVLEIKNVKIEYHELAKQGVVPLLYAPQVQAQMFISGYEDAYYLSWGHEPAWVHVIFDDEFINEALPKIEEFKRCLDNLVEPELTERDYVDKSDDVFLTDKVQMYKYYQKMAKEYESKCEILKEEICSMVNHRNTKGQGFRVTKYTTQGRVDYSAIPELKDVKLDKYRKPCTTNFRLTLD